MVSDVKWEKVLETSTLYLSILRKNDYFPILSNEDEDV